MVVTSCLICSKSVLLEHPIQDDNKDPDGFIVCKKCYALNYSPEKILQKERESKLSKLLKKKWYKFWI
jgi:hypothetical protein